MAIRRREWVEAILPMFNSQALVPLAASLLGLSIMVAIIVCGPIVPIWARICCTASCCALGPPNIMFSPDSAGWGCSRRESMRKEEAEAGAGQGLGLTRFVFVGPDAG